MRRDQLKQVAIAWRKVAKHPLVNLTGVDRFGSRNP